MKLMPLALLALLSACPAMVNNRRHVAQEPPPPSLDRGFTDLRSAIADLENTGAPFDTGPIKGKLEEAFAQLCKEQRVSCTDDLPGWRTRGGAGPDLSHALGAVDRAFTLFAHQVGYHYGSKIGSLEEARDEIREQLLRRDRLALGPHLPPTRSILLFRKDLEYVRSLVDGMPAAEVPWDYERELMHLDAMIHRLRTGGFDPDAAQITAEYLPDPADFAALPYRERIRVAADILDRAATALERDHDRFALLSTQAEQSFEHDLNDAVNGLKGVPSGEIHVAPILRGYKDTTPDDPYDQQLVDLREVATELRSHGAAQPLSEVEDAFKAALVAEHLPTNDLRWEPNASTRSGDPVGMIDGVIAAFETAPGNRLADSLRHLETARHALRVDQAGRLSPELGAYALMRNELIYVRAMIDVATTPDAPWDPRAAVAELDAALAALRSPDPHSVRTNGLDPAVYSKVPYRRRLWISRDVLQRAAAELEAAPAKGPRASVLRAARAVAAALDGALGQRGTTVATSQGSAGRASPSSSR